MELTETGIRVFDQIAAREAEGQQALEARFDAKDLAAATQTLRSLRKAISDL